MPMRGYVATFKRGGFLDFVTGRKLRRHSLTASFVSPAFHAGPRQYGNLISDSRILDENSIEHIVG
ncbi:MAG: hypothetical protein IPL01_05905 [Acidobacteria bacterium]|nr:hypothetical protein [Acidobacteriota bacterium]